MCLLYIYFLITKWQDVVCIIYLLIFYNHWNLYVLYANCSFLVHLKVLPFFVAFLFIHSNFSNNFTLALCFSLFWWFIFLFFSLERRSRWQRWLCLTRFYHFASFHDLLFHRHFMNKMYSFLLIFVATLGNIKSHLTFHTIIIHPTEIFRKEHSVNVLINLFISYKVFLELQEMFVVFNKKIINSFRCVLVFQWQFI